MSSSFFNFRFNSDFVLMVAIFVTMAFCTNMALTDDDRQHAKDSDKKQNNDTIQQDTTKKIIIDNFIAHKDSTIKHLFYEIDSIAYNKEKNTSDSINNNKDIVARNTINKQLDSLRYDSKIQLKRAQRAAEQSPSYISDIPCNEETFYTFFHVPEVKRAHRTYDKNQRTIEKLRAARRKLPQSTTITRNITQYFDSLSNAQIMNRLLMIERLLQQKDSTISEKRR